MARDVEMKLRDALAELLGRSVRYHGQRVEYASVQRVSPLAVELQTGGERLEEPDTLVLPPELRQSARGLDKDDAIVVSAMSDGRYVVLALAGDTDIPDRASTEDVDAVAGAFVGQIVMSAVTSPGTAWLACDGSAVTTTHAALRTKLLADSSPYGTSGSNPRLPNLNSGRVPLGADGTHVLGATGGAETVTLSTAQIPAHAHKAPGQVLGTLYSAGGSPLQGWNPATVDGSSQPGESIGGGTSHPNMQPWLGVLFFIYAG